MKTTNLGFLLVLSIASAGYAQRPPELPPPSTPPFPFHQDEVERQQYQSELERLKRIVHRLDSGPIQIPRTMHITIDARPEHAREVNGHAQRRTNEIDIDLGSFRELPDDELAFLIAHEIGHLEDRSDACENVNDHSQHDCEDNADWTAEQYMLSAGYSPYAGAALFGRWMMMGNRASFTEQLITTMFDSHRSEIGRTNNLRASWRHYCQRFTCAKHGM